MNKEQIIKELDKQNRELGEELSLIKDKLDKTLFEKEHYKHLYSELKKQKDDVVEYIKEIKKHREEGLTITEYKTKWRSMFDYLESDEIINNLLRMLGEIDD